MKILILSVGKIKDPEIKSKVDAYIKRIKHDAVIDYKTLKDSDIQTEAKKIIGFLKKENGYTIALSEEGNGYTSKEFAKKILKDKSKIIFVIGGPFGLDRTVKEHADSLLSLSKMTISHEMAQLFLVEQIYRGISINLNRKYHKG